MADEPKNENERRALELFNDLWNSPTEAGQALRAKAKEKYPEIRLPEEVVEPAIAPLLKENAAMAARLEAIEAERKAEKETAAQNAAQTNLETMLANARQRFNLTDDGFDKMCARMKETGNYTDAEAAAAWVAQQTPPPAAPGPYLGPQNINLFGSSEKNEEWELLHADPGGRFLDDQFKQFMSDPDQYVRDAGFA